MCAPGGEKRACGTPNACSKPHSHRPIIRCSSSSLHATPLSSIPTLDQGRREDNSDLSSPTSWTHQEERGGERGGWASLKMGDSDEFEIQRVKGWDVSNTDWPPVLHVDKHMSIGRWKVFVGEQTELYIVQDCGQQRPTGHIAPTWETDIFLTFYNINISYQKIMDDMITLSWNYDNIKYVW